MSEDNPSAPQESKIPPLTSLQKFRFALGAIFFAGFFIAGVFFVFGAAFHTFNLTHFQGKTTGVATGEYDLVPDLSRGSDGDAYALEYVYTVDGEEYTVNGSIHYYQEDKAIAAADEYTGVEITVFYMLDDPYDTITDGEKDALF